MTWVPVLPALVIAGLVLTVPGLVVGAALGLRREPWLGAAPLLSVGCVGIAIPVSAVLGIEWGLLPIVLTTLSLSALGGGCWWLVRRVVPGLAATDPGVHTSRPVSDHLVFLGTIAACAVWVGAICIHTIGDVATVQQTYDAVFHLNAISRVAEAGSATPDVVVSTSNTRDPSTFYPPTFHALGGLLVSLLGVTPVVSANVVAVVTAAVVWVPSAALLAHVVMARHRFGVLAATIAACTFPLFPYLLMSFGVLWPNLLSIAVLPAVLSVIVVVLAQAPVPTIPWISALAAGLLSTAGLYYAHPGGIFAAIALGLPVLLTVVMGRLVVLWRRFRFGPLWVVLVLVAIVLAVRVSWGWLLEVPQVASTVQFDWPAGMTEAQAIGNAYALATPLSSATWLLAALVLWGAVVAVKRPHQRWLVLAHALAMYLYTLAAGSDEALSNELTGFWYNDQYRLAALLPITAAPLVGIGLLGARDMALGALAEWHRCCHWRATPHLRASSEGSRAWEWGIGVGILGLFILLLPGHLLPSNPRSTLQRGYYPSSQAEELVDIPERELYARLLAPSKGDGQTVIGDPWSGGGLAGPISGRKSVLGHMVNIMDADRQLLSRHFKEIGTDPRVCAAAQRLRVGYAVEDSRTFWPYDRRSQGYPGLDGLQSRPGLTEIGREGTVSVYRVEPCRS